MSRHYRRSYHRRRHPLEGIIGMGIWSVGWWMLANNPLFTIGVFMIFTFIVNSDSKSKNKGSTKTSVVSRKQSHVSTYTSNNTSPKRSIGENRLYEIVKEQYPKEKILRNERPDWLKNDANHNLELDIFLPEIDLAFEYNGKQHREHVPFFGTIAQFEKQKRNDEIKRETCKSKGIVLIEIWFDEPLNKSFVNKKIKDKQSLDTTNNVIPIYQNSINATSNSNQRYVSQNNPPLPCITCGFSVCNLDYHYGA